MAGPFKAHAEMLQGIVKALGFEGRRVRRVVLDISVNDVVKMYVEEFPTAEQIGALVTELAGVEVASVSGPPAVGPEPLLKIVGRRRECREPLPDVSTVGAYEEYAADDLHVVTTSQAVS